jgi:hypothetical protein
MGDNPTWPLLSHQLQHNKKIADDPIVILYFPLAGGEFLAKILSCCAELYGESYFDFLKNYYSYKESDWLSTYEDDHHEKLFPAHARYFTFNEWLNFDKIIYINYNLSQQETDWLLFRKSFIYNTVYINQFADLQIKYEKEVLNFFHDNNKSYFDFPLTCFLNENDFINKVNECLSYLNLTKLDKNKVLQIYKMYMKLNIKKYQDKIK